MSDEPFATVVRMLLQERGLTFRGLAERTREVDAQGRGLSHGYIAGLGRHEDPTVPAIELVAAALDVDPTEFAEYRLALARQLFDERHVGLERALDNMRLLGANADGAVPPPPERLIRLASAAGARAPRRRDSRAGAQR